MDQSALRELEQRCIQEEPPWCTAACPLHIDVRAFVGHMARKNWTDAWKVLGRSMPLPGVLGRICDAPCEKHCKLGEVGEPLCIGALERACVQTEQPAFRIPPLPAKGKKIAVAGSGLSSLTVAWDLARKGYGVTVFEPGETIGAPLLRLNKQRLPGTVIQQEIDRLIHLGVSFESSFDCEAVDTMTLWQSSSFDAVYLGLDGIKGQGWALERDGDGRIRFDPKTMATRIEGVFAGGQTESPVWQACQGRWAATSIDRWLQGVSLTAARDKEGPYETRLFTRLDNILPNAAVAPANPTAGYCEDEAAAEAGRCLSCECLECVKTCVYLEKFRAYPKKYAREIYNNLSIVMGEHKANALINACSLCGLCEQVCPNDFAMQDLCLQARQVMVDSGKMPPSAHEFALLDMAFSQSGRFAMARHQPDFETSAYLFFPGCQLCASAPGQVEAVYTHLKSTLPDGVGLMLNCCGAPAHWAGRRQVFDTHLTHITAQWEKLGRPQMILACSTCWSVFKAHLPAIPMTSLWSILETYPTIPDSSFVHAPLAIHDPCTTRSESKLQVAIRHLIKVAGLDIEEMPLSGANTECCGFGGLMQNAAPDLARSVAQRRSARSNRDYITYCAMCRDNLVAEGKRAIHVLDLFFPDPQQRDPALRPRPGWSLRQENRARLKAHLLTCLWHEVPDPMHDHQPLEISFSEQVSDLLDQRRILVEDLQQVIQYAEQSGDRLFHPPSGRYKAAYAPYKVTFWVEYSRNADGYIVHNAYAHRMEVIGP